MSDLCYGCRHIIYLMKTDRPDQFRWLILGNTQVKQLLQSAVSHNAVAHAYLFLGPAHVGKYSMATLLTGSLICQSKDMRQPCFQCPACDQLSKGIHPDVDTVVPNDYNTIPISSIRALQHKLSLRSFLTEYKVAIIDHADLLSEEASNALLKTLEEPTPKTTFILTAESKDSIPLTILSRCQIIQFNLVPAYQIENWLISKGFAKNISATAAHISNGRPGLALDLAENPLKIEERSDQINKLITVLSGSVHDRLSLAYELVGSKDDSEKQSQVDGILNIWLAYFRDLLLATAAKTLPMPMQKKVAHTEVMRHYTPERIIHSVNKIMSAKNLLRKSVNTRLVLENLVLNV